MKLNELIEAVKTNYDALNREVDSAINKAASNGQQNLALQLNEVTRALYKIKQVGSPALHSELQPKQDTYCTFCLQPGCTGECCNDL